MFPGVSQERSCERGWTDSSSKVESLVVHLESQPAGRFGSAFLASFITIVREGVEVILILAMLLALVGKATSASGLRAPAEGQRDPDGLASDELDLARCSGPA